MEKASSPFSEAEKPPEPFGGSEIVYAQRIGGNATKYEYRGGEEKQQRFGTETVVSVHRPRQRDNEWVIVVSLKTQPVTPKKGIHSLIEGLNMEISVNDHWHLRAQAQHAAADSSPEVNTYNDVLKSVTLFASRHPEVDFPKLAAVIQDIVRGFMERPAGTPERTMQPLALMSERFAPDLALAGARDTVETYIRRTTEEQAWKAVYAAGVLNEAGIAPR